MSKRSRRWTWTLNNPTAEETAHLKDNGSNRETRGIRYLTWGNEIAPTTGTPHLQGYVEFSTLKSLAQLKKVVSPRAHLDASDGDAKQNTVYAQKDGDFVVYGTYKERGKRTDILMIQDMIDAGATDRDIAIRYFSSWSRMRNAVKAYRQLINPKKMSIPFTLNTFSEIWRNAMETSPLKVRILWGPTNIGKTCFCKALLPNALMVSHMDDLAHFNPEEYDGIIFDDMDFRHFPRTSQIHILDYNDDRSIHIRYAVAHIPAGTTKLFTTNEDRGGIFDLSDTAIKRRVAVHHLSDVRLLGQSLPI